MLLPAHAIEDSNSSGSKDVGDATEQETDMQQQQQLQYNSNYDSDDSSLQEPLLQVPKASVASPLEKGQQQRQPPPQEPRQQDAGEPHKHSVLQLIKLSKLWEVARRAGTFLSRYGLIGTSNHPCSVVVVAAVVVVYH